ncbi:MAG: leucine--tRNA ligase [Sulfolobales archaeon]
MRWLNNIAFKWQREWDANKIYEEDPRADMPKFFITAAFPYPNSPTHIGNARSFLLADVIARYMRARGYNSLYPMGFHYTGTPILTMAESIAKNDSELIELFREFYEVPENEISRMKDPLELARYFHRVSRESMRMLGLGIDWRREFTTVDPEFQSFIRWQFRRLYEKNYVSRGTYPVGWCPLHQMPVGGHDTKDDKDPEIEEFTLVFFRDSRGRILPTATLRPETVFAVTNLWVNPDTEYAEVLVGGALWIISRKAYEKLIYQKDSIEILRSFKGSELEGLEVINPVTGEHVYVIPASFVDPGFGTGVVMSVPSHSPDDYIAYMESMRIERYREYLERSPKPRKIIDLPGVRDLPAKWIVERLGIRSSRERESLEKATRELYNLEFTSGVMHMDLDRYILSGEEDLIRSVKNLIVGRKVSEARENISKILRERGRGDIIYELINAPVYCRCGTEIVVKVLKDQWFIRYSDPAWKREGLKALDRMEIIPEEMKNHMRELIEGLREKPCARTRGLGTPLPWDPSWIIESLSDSTIYMAFYTVIHRIRSLKIDPGSLDDEFWSYIMLGEGDPSRIASRIRVGLEDLESLRREFLYWYPLDVRVAGRDLANNHLLFFIMNHTAIFPEDLWPKKILVHGWVLREGEKMSKSRRNITPLFKAIRDKSSDVVRLTLAISSEVDQDLDFRDSTADSIAFHLKKLYDMIYAVRSKRFKDEPDERELFIAARIARRILKADEALRRFRIREAGNILFFEIFNDFSEILSRESIWRGFKDIIREWIKLLSVYTPHLAEEIWRNVLGESSFVVREIVDLEKIKGFTDVVRELEEEYLKSVIEDLREIISLTGIKPSRIILYTSGGEDYQLLREALESSMRREGLREFIGRNIMRVDESSRRTYAEKLRKIFEQATKISAEFRELVALVDSFDERTLASRLSSRIKELYPDADVKIYYYRDPEAPDPGGKKNQALPLKPSIYIQ